ncbi:MAG: glycosyltransferase [Gemmatimonadota bacterium]|nr:glycosyltransferase [Gemmatimonadota bacterium]
MRILQFNLAYAPAWSHGGPPRVLFDYAKTLVARGHEVTVFTTDTFDVNTRIPNRTDNLDGVQIHYFPNLSNYLAWHRRRYIPIGFFSAIRNRLREFDVVHVSETRSYGHAIISRYLNVWNVPYVYSGFGSLPRRSEGIKTIYDPLFVTPLLKGARSLLAQTEHEAQEYVKYGGSQDRVSILPLAVDPTQIGEVPPRDVFRKRFEIPDDAHLLLFLGRLHASKGVVTLLKLFDAARKQDPLLHLAIVGRDDGNAEEIVQTIKDRELQESVTLTGPLYDQDRFMAYSGADLFVFTPAIWEETSLASLEALACGTLVLASRRADIPWLEAYQAGRIWEPGDHQSFIDWVSEFFTQPLEHRASMKLKTKRLIDEKFALTRVVDDLENKLLSAAHSE